MSSSSSRPRTTPRLRGSEPCTQTPEGGRAPLALGSRAIVICRKPEVAGSAQVREQLASLSTLSNLCVFFERRQERHSCFLLNAFMSMEMRGLSKFNYGTGCRHVSIRGNESSKKDLREKLIQMRKSCSSGAGGLGCESGGSVWGAVGTGAWALAPQPAGLPGTEQPPSWPGAWSPGFHADRPCGPPAWLPHPCVALGAPPSTSGRSWPQVDANGARQSRYHLGASRALVCVFSQENAGPCHHCPGQRGLQLPHVLPTSLLTGGHPRGAQVLAPCPSPRNTLGTQGSTFATMKVNQ